MESRSQFNEFFVNRYLNFGPLLRGLRPSLYNAINDSNFEMRPAVFCTVSEMPILHKTWNILGLESTCIELRCNIDRVQSYQVI